MDDGLGFSIGSILGGSLFQAFGGKISFQIFTLLAFITCIAHIFLRPTSTHDIRSIRNKTPAETKDNMEIKEVEEMSLNT